MASKAKSAVFTLLRTILGIGIAAFLISRTMQKSGMTTGDLLAALGGASRLLLVLAVCIHGLVLCLTTLRWWLLLRAQDIAVRWRDCLRMTLIGFFFNLAVPGAVGGDISKVGYLAKDCEGKATEAIFSIVVDRLIGILGLFFVAAACVLLSLPKLLALPEEHAFIKVAAMVVGLGSVAGILGLLALEFHAVLLNLPGLRRLWPVLGRVAPAKIAATVSRLIAAVDVYRRRRRIIALAVAMSVGVHAALAFNLFAVGRALHETGMPLREYFLTTQVSNAIASVPVTPGGVGLRDRSNQEFLIAFGMSGHLAALLPITVTLIILFWAMVGMVTFIASPGIKTREIAPETLPPHLPLEPCE